MFKNLSLKTKTFVMLMFIVFIATLPLIGYYLKTARGLSELGQDRDIELSLNKSVDLAPVGTEKDAAVLALKKYMQIAALKTSILNQVLAFTIVYFVAVVLIALFLGLFFISRITRPLQELTRATRVLSQDNLEFSLSTRAGGEIGLLVEAFNRMIGDLKVAREQRTLAERRATWQQVARTIAHEIKNPLTPIKLSTERMVDKYENNAKDFPAVMKSTAATILSEVENLQKLVETFHQYAKFPDPVLKEEDVNVLLTEAADLFKGEKVEIKLSVAAVLPKLQLDRGQIRQALTNLIKNAVQALEGAEQPGVIRIESWKEEGRILVMVADNGPGIAPDNLKKLFQPYFTTKKHGSGIGLALTERIVSLHNGKITCRSEEGKGAEFIMEFTSPPPSPPLLPRDVARGPGEGGLMNEKEGRNPR
ncbi:MAG: ATP-binding protein [Fibrobacterota bacterium]